MMTNGVVHANLFGIKDWVTPYKIAVLVLLNEMGRTGEGAVSLVERRKLNQLLLPLLQVRGAHSFPPISTSSLGPRPAPGAGKVQPGVGVGGSSRNFLLWRNLEK